MLLIYSWRRKCVILTCRTQHSELDGRTDQEIYLTDHIREAPNLVTNAIGSEVLMASSTWRKLCCSVNCSRNRDLCFETFDACEYDCCMQACSQVQSRPDEHIIWVIEASLRSVIHHLQISSNGQQLGIGSQNGSLNFQIESNLEIGSLTCFFGKSLPRHIELVECISSSVMH